MKKTAYFCTLLWLCLFTLQASAQNLFTKGIALPYNTGAIVTLNTNGPFPMANVTFKVGNVAIGNITLSQMQPRYQNLNYSAMRQSLTINSITYSPGFGQMQGSIFLSGSVTDAGGGNRMPFNLQLL